jgi:glycosyltransferase involved in cell wall biosynthesis
MSDVQLQRDASDFRTFRRSVAESILKLTEYHRFSKGIFAWVGFNTCYIPYTACERHAGTTKWSFTKLMNYAIEGIIGFSTKPLRLATYLGSLTAVAALIYLVVVVLQKLIVGIAIPGYATTIVLILLLGGMQLLCIGIIGEYIGKIFEQSKDRPIYLAKEVISNQDR